MGAKTNIEWTDSTWNPVAGCSRISPGCVNCYAERIAARFSGKGQAYEGLAKMTPEGPRWTGVLRLLDEKLALPLRWKKGRRIFVNSTSDLFHEALADEAIDRVLAVMLLAPHHTFQVLTKRAQRMAEYFAAPWLYQRVLRHVDALRAARPELPLVGVSDPARWLPKHVWLGVSVEDELRAWSRIPELLKTPALVRFLSVEPLLGEIDLTPWLGKQAWLCRMCMAGVELGEEARADLFPTAETRALCPRCDAELEGSCNDLVSWVIVGGESGPGARPLHPEWVRDVRGQCAQASVPFFFKQWGAWKPVVPCYPHEDAVDADGNEVDVPYELSQYDGYENVALEPSGAIPHHEWPDDTFRVDYQPGKGSWWLSKVGAKHAGATLDGAEHRAFPEP